MKFVVSLRLSGHPEMLTYVLSRPCEGHCGEPRTCRAKSRQSPPSAGKDSLPTTKCQANWQHLLLHAIPLEGQGNKQIGCMTKSRKIYAAGT